MLTTLGDMTEGRKVCSTNEREWIGRCVRFGLNTAPLLKHADTLSHASNFGKQRQLPVVMILAARDRERE